MPLPIDPNTEIMRVTLAERIQQISDRLSLLGQARQSLNEEQQRVIDETQVKETHQKSEQVDTELKRRNPFLGRKKKKAEEDSKEIGDEINVESPENEEEGGSHLDIQV